MHGKNASRYTGPELEDRIHGDDPDLFDATNLGDHDPSCPGCHICTNINDRRIRRPRPTFTMVCTEE